MAAVEAWIARLAGVKPEPLLEPSTATAAPMTGSVDPAALDRLDAMTGGDPIGLQLLAVAAVRLVLTSWSGRNRHAVVMPVGDRESAAEVCLCSPLDAGDSVIALLNGLHSELESAISLAWLRRTDVEQQLTTAGLPAGRALSQIAVHCAGVAASALAPSTVLVRVERTEAGLSVLVDAPLTRLPTVATALGPCVAAALASIAEDPRQACGDVDILGDGQRAELADWSGLPSPARFPAVTLPQLVGASAQRIPDQPAVTDGVVTWTHRQLWAMSGDAAALLSGQYGVKRGDRVALLLPRSPALVLAILATLRAGASYVPLDPAHPPARFIRQLALSGAGLVVTADGDTPAGVTTTAIAATELIQSSSAGWPGDGPGPDDEAVLFFTSGSTGVPRPVALKHRQLAFKAVSSGELVGFDTHTRCAILSAISSDALIYQIFTTLAAGGCVVTLDEVDKLAPREFWKTVNSLGINAVNCVPSLLSAMADGLPEGARQYLRHCFLGGDEIPRGLLPRLADRLEVGTFANLYGPTEATVEAVSFVCPGTMWEMLPVVPIGKPSPGFAVIVLTEHGDFAPVGVAGEMYILGPGVAEGYLDGVPAGPNRFVRLPQYPGVPVFRTGDFARWRPDGLLDFLGRADNQLQIHGNRVEPAEVEAALSRIAGVTAAAVVPDIRPPHPPRLIVAYHSDIDVGPDSVRAELSAQLPPYMVPGLVLRVPALPLTPIGKVDRQAILALAADADDVSWEPDDGLGQTVAGAWAEVLGRRPRSADEDFIAAGGHSLTAMMLTNRLCRVLGDEAITVRQVFAARTPAALVTALAQRSEPRPLMMPQSHGAGRLPASNAQRRMWFLEQYEDGDLRPYNMVECFALRGPVEVEVLRRALRAVVARHESLRTAFSFEGDQLYQHILPPEQVDIELAVHHAGAAELPHLLGELSDSAQRHRMDLGAGAPMSASWVDSGEEGGTLLLCVHHAVFDGWSFSVVLRDLLTALDQPEPDARAEPNAQADALPEAVQYARHSLELGARHASEEGQRSRDYWHRLLAGLPDVQIPGDRHRTARRSSAGGAVQTGLDDFTVNGLRALCRGAGATPFEGFVAAIRVLLFRLYRHADIALGSVTAGRDDPRLAGSVGLFANTIVLRTLLTPQGSFRELIARVAQDMVGCRVHQDYPFEMLVEELGVDRAAGRNPIFDVLVESVISGLEPGGPADERVLHISLESKVSDFDLVFGFRDDEAGPAEALLSFRSDIFDRSTIERMAAQLEHLLRQLVLAPDAPVASIPYLPPSQRDFLLQTANRTAAPFPSERTLLELVEDQVRSWPDAAAVIYGDRSLTFGELDLRAEQLAARLASVARTGPGTATALVCERTDWMVVAMLAVLKTGSAFMPLDPEQPPARIADIVRRSGATAVLSDVADSAAFGVAGVPIVRPGGDATSASPGRAWPRVASEDLAYIVHTSGSTGTPKGILIENRGIVNTVHYRAGYYGFDRDSTVLQVPPIHFDSGINDVFSALIAGTPVVVISRDALLDPDAVAAAIEANEVTHMMLVPSLYQLLLERAAAALRSVRQVVLVGERLPEALAQRHAELLPETVLYNEYGPAEDSVWTTVHRLVDLSSDVLIGHPIANKTVDLLDPDGGLVPIGLPGEICIGGVGVARGYLNDPELTSRRFRENPVRPGTRMYSTGDLARRLTDGNLQYLGRIDNQVKIRGQRVEPDEVAAVLSHVPGVQNAAVIAVTEATGNIKLIAYLVGDAEQSVLREFMMSRLPAAMVPSVFVVLPELPVTANGKLDRRALPPPPQASEALTGEEAFTPAEESIAQIWSSLLGRPVTSPDDNFFELGGHSLVAARIAQDLGISIRMVMANQSVRQLAAATATIAAEDRRAAPSPSTTVNTGVDAFPLSRAQYRIWLSARRDQADSYVISDLVRLRRRLDVPDLTAALDYVVQRHQQLRVSVEGDSHSDSGSAGAMRQTAADRLAGGPPLRVVELPGVDPDGPEVAAALKEARAVSFDLGRAPMFEVRLLRGPAGGDLLTLTVHHFVYDLASVHILLNDLFTAYEQIQAGTGPRLPELLHAYSDWVFSEQNWLRGPQSQRSVDFWSRRLDGVTEQPDLIDASRRGRTRGRSLLTRRELAWSAVADRAATPYAMVVTAFAALIHRHTGVRDLTLGTPASLRQEADADGVIGCFINAVPVRLQWEPATTFGQLLEHAADRILEAVEHSRLPFEELVRQLGLRGRPGRSILLDLGVTWESASLRAEAYELEDILPADMRASSDLWLYAARHGDQLRLELAADADLVRPSEHEAFSDELVELLSAVASRPELPVADPASIRPAWSETRYDF